jgi:hypothetical protein
MKMTEEKEKPVVPWLPWTWAPPAVMMGKAADKLGLPNSEEGLPSLPLPARVWLACTKPFSKK